MTLDIKVCFPSSLNWIALLLFLLWWYIFEFWRAGWSDKSFAATKQWDILKLCDNVVKCSNVFKKSCDNFTVAPVCSLWQLKCQNTFVLQTNTKIVTNYHGNTDNFFGWSLHLKSTLPQQWSSLDIHEFDHSATWQPTILVRCTEGEKPTVQYMCTFSLTVFQWRFHL